MVRSTQAKRFSLHTLKQKLTLFCSYTHYPHLYEIEIERFLEQFGSLPNDDVQNLQIKCNRYLYYTLSVALLVRNLEFPISLNYSGCLQN